MKKELASFRDFLATGTLGPLSPDMRLIEVAKILGSPDGWNIDKDALVPLYWFFGKLEISFGHKTPYQMNWFQIEGAAQLKGKREPLTEQLALSMDGFTGETRPSEFLAAGLWDSALTKIYYAVLSDSVLLNICAGGVQIHFQIDASSLGDRQAIDCMDGSVLPRLVRDIDARTKVDSIYSYPQTASEEVPGAFNWQSITGQEYLYLLR